MTVSEYANLEEQCKNNTLGKKIDYDGSFGAQCWDLVQYYVVEYLGVPPRVLGGCDLVSNMLFPPKLNDLLQYFDEVPITQMLKGDIVIWNAGHIAIFDSWDGIYCWYLTQNTGTAKNPNGGTYLGTFDLGEAHAFRLKGIMPDSQPEPQPIEPVGFKVGDYVVPTILVDYQGTPLVQWDDLYQILEKDGRGNVLGAVRGDERPIWAVLPDSNIKKVD